MVAPILFHRRSKFRASFTNTYSTRFDGVNETGLSANAEPAFGLSTPWSVSFWMHAPTASPGEIILSKFSNALGNGWYLYQSGLDVGLVLDGGSGDASCLTSTDIVSNTWSHIVFTVDGSNNGTGMNVYVDDSLNNGTRSGTVSGDYTTGMYLGVGHHPDFNGQYYEGLLDQIAFFDKELNSTEVTEVYNSGVPFDLRTSTCSSNLVHYYFMGDDDTHPVITDQVGTNDITLTNSEPGDFVEDVP